MAKMISLPESGEMTAAEYRKLKDHLANSALWYAFNMSVNSAQIIDKLKAKGLTDEPIVVVDKDGKREQHNPIQETIDFLHESHALDDEGYAERLLERVLSQGKGLGIARFTLTQKQVDEKIIQKMLADYATSDEGFRLNQGALNTAYKRALRSSSYKKELAKEASGAYGNSRGAIVRAMATKGFAFDEINDYLDQLEEESDGETI